MHNPAPPWCFHACINEDILGWRPHGWTVTQLLEGNLSKRCSFLSVVLRLVNLGGLERGSGPAGLSLIITDDWQKDSVCVCEREREIVSIHSWLACSFAAAFASNVQAGRRCRQMFRGGGVGRWRSGGGVGRPSGLHSRSRKGWDSLSLSGCLSGKALVDTRCFSKSGKVSNLESLRGILLLLPVPRKLTRNRCYFLWHVNVPLGETPTLLIEERSSLCLSSPRVPPPFLLCVMCSLSNGPPAHFPRPRERPRTVSEGCAGQTWTRERERKKKKKSLKIVWMRFGTLRYYIIR